MSIQKLTTAKFRTLALGLALLTPVLIFANIDAAYADRGFKKFFIVLNRSSGPAVAGLKTKNYLQELANTKFVYLDLKVLLDGTDVDAVLQSTEEADRRSDVDCQPGQFGPLPMVSGMEYYLATSYEGKRIEATFYPGSRANHTYNDVACTYDPRAKKRAVFHLRGFFAVVSNTYEESISFQLRPIIPTTKEAAGALLK